MSREIKFRAWSNEHNRYCDFVTLDDCGRWIGWIEIGRVYLTTADIIIEQYTGDKDCFNTPICEGDIVRICETDIAQVIQDYDGRWVILGVPKEKLRDGDSVVLGDLKKSIKWGLADILSKEYCSVIGNIHENPELLGGER